MSGAIAERAAFNGYIIFSILISGLVYPVHAHWCWGPDGWLADKGFYDFAGSGVVHLAGATCGFFGKYDQIQKVRSSLNGINFSLLDHGAAIWTFQGWQSQ